MIKKIKTILINPPLSLEERYGRDLDKFGASSEPLGLAYLAANLEKHGYLVYILDSLALNWGISQTVEAIKKEGADLIGITMLTPMYEVVKRLAGDLKQAMPSVKIILGGAHATALSKETLEDIEPADYICIGEGENTIVDLADYLSDSIKGDISKINGLAWRNTDGRIIFNQPRQFEKDLDKLPAPAQHLLPMAQYHLTASRVKNSDYCPTLIIARGCPFNCAFCSHPFGRSFRHHSVDRIISEIKNLIEKYHISQLNFEADTLTVDKNFLSELCQALIKEDFHQRINWTCESRINTVDEGLLRLMKQAGCWQISYGIESGVQRLLDLINKGVTIEEIERVVALTKKIGITIRGFFILGLPTETAEESWQTINFAKKLDPLWAQFTIAVPYPGTPLFEILKKQNKIRHFNWADYSTWAGWADKKLPFVPDGRTEAEIKKLQKQALISFYLRPKVFFKFLKQVKSFSIFKRYLTGFFILVRNKVKPL